MFDFLTYTRRREVLASTVGSGIILFPGNNESPMNYADNGYHFRQDSTFLYYFGIDFPGLVAVIDIDNQVEMIFGDDYTIDHIVWMGPQPTIAERAALAGVTRVYPLSKLSSVIGGYANRKLHYLPPYRPEHILFYHELLAIPTGDVHNHVSIDLIKAVVGQRECKTDLEIAEIEKAVDLSVDMHVAAMTCAREGMTEARVAARVQEVAMAANGQLSFPIIATINGQTLHNHYHGNVLRKGDLLLLDAGAEVESHYAGDLSSTFPVDAKFSPIQKVVYQMSLQAHQAAIDALALHTPFRDVHFAACRSVAESMKSLGLLNGNVDDMLQAGVHALFLPSGTGHMMGLDVHDMENLGEVWVGYDGVPKSTQFGLKSLRFAKPLKPGHVFTIEPGIYFIPELMDKWRAENKFSEFINWDELAKYRSFGGIRNEENYMMTESGPRRLGSKVKPKTIDEVEAIRADCNC